MKMKTSERRNREKKYYKVFLVIFCCCAFVCIFEAALTVTHNVLSLSVLAK